MATVVLPGALRQYTGGLSKLEVDTGDAGSGATLALVLDALDASCPALARRIRDEQGVLRRYVNVYIDGEDARLCGGLDAPVPARAEVIVLPSVAGG
jgi:molybdopterin converting factor small subunit